MAEFPMPATLRDHVARTEYAELRSWAEELPVVVADLAARWGLRLGPPYQPGGYTAWVAPAVDPGGRPGVLKVGWAHPDAAHEVDGLRLWRNTGAVEVYAAERFGRTTAMLLERCEPGTPLAATVDEPDQDAVVTGLLRRLWTVRPEPGPEFRPLWRMCDEWAAEAEMKFEGAGWRSGERDPGLVRAGLAAFRELPRASTDTVVLCTDLHAGNILAAVREPWLLIDPKPHVGDPAYDILQHMLNCSARLSADPGGLARRMADQLDLDADRVSRWTFARCVQESVADNDELYAVARRLAP